MSDLFARLSLALGLGLLVGLQRQRTDARIAGFRTFPLVTLAGTLCGLLAQELGGWVVAGGLVALALVILGGELPLLRRDEEQPGVTTEVAMLVMFAVGAYLAGGAAAVGIATCGAVVVLLHLKPQLHSLAQKIGDNDFRAMMQFALISLVILPVLPDRAYGPFAVLNPFKLWLMVVLIVGISLGGYVIYKLLGGRGGAWATAILGGMISSTATAVSFARRSRESAPAPRRTAFVILIASAIVFFRVGLLAAATSPPLFRRLLWPLLTMAAVLAVLGTREFGQRETEAAWLPEQGNPSELKPALLFGALYAAVLFAVAAAKEFFGPRGLYVTAMVSGLMDMDAITLSVSHLFAHGEVGGDTAWRLVVVAAMANLAFKSAIVAALGARRLGAIVARGLGLCFLAGAAMLLAG